MKEQRSADKLLIFLSVSAEVSIFFLLDVLATDFHVNIFFTAKIGSVLYHRLEKRLTTLLDKPPGWSGLLTHVLGMSARICRSDLVNLRGMIVSRSLMCKI